MHTTALHVLLGKIKPRDFDHVLTFITASLSLLVHSAEVDVARRKLGLVGGGVCFTNQVTVWSSLPVGLMLKSIIGQALRSTQDASPAVLFFFPSINSTKKQQSKGHGPGRHALWFYITI